MPLLPPWLEPLLPPWLEPLLPPWLEPLLPPWLEPLPQAEGWCTVASKTSAECTP